MTKAAILDKDGVLKGFAARQAKKGEVDVPDACDLVPGRYVHRDGAFWPLPPKAKKRDELDPDAMRAIWKGFAALRLQGVVDFPAETIDWIDAYGRTLDAKG